MSNLFDRVDYLEAFCNRLKQDLPDDIFSCEIYGGQLEEDSTNYLNFNVNKKAQCFIAHVNTTYNKGHILTGEAKFAVFVVAIVDADKKSGQFSSKGMRISQKVTSFINNTDDIADGTISRPHIIDDYNIADKLQKNKLYSIQGILYTQDINLKQ